jgi:uncharacterized protein (DUF697 family)
VNLLSLYEKLESLVQRLPESLQSPILREITPIKSLFLLQRPPRILLLGDRAASRTALVNALFGSEVAHVSEDHLQDGTWQVFSRPGKGTLRLLDARRPASLQMLRRALSAEAPDLCLYLYAEPVADADLEADLEQSRLVEEHLRQRHQARPELIAISAGKLSSSDLEPVRRLNQAMDSEAHGFRDRVAGIHSLDGTTEVHKLAFAISQILPDESKLEMARLSGVKEVQREIAQVVIKSMTAITGAVGTQPIPLADFPVLTSLQVAMVAGIMHISGRELSTKMAGQWIAALGANIGVAIALREGARAMLKVVPVWGDLVSGGIAAGGTYAIGRAASGYFIEGISLEDAKKLFRSKKKRRAMLEDTARK